MPTRTKILIGLQWEKIKNKLLNWYFHMMSTVLVNLIASKPFLTYIEQNI
jgi:hypothetical protein